MTTIKCVKAVNLQPGTQTWVEMTTARPWLIVVEPHERLYNTAKVIATNGIVHVEPGIPFRVLMANVGKHPYRISKNQAVASALPHPTGLAPKKIPIEEVLGIEIEEIKSSDDEPCPSRANESEKSQDKPGKPEIKEVEDLDLSHLEPHRRDRSIKMLAKYRKMWDGTVRRREDQNPRA